MSRPQEDGATARDHFNKMWRQSGVKPPELENAPPCPPLGLYLWQYFVDLHSERGTDINGGCKLTARNILDWQFITGTSLELWERRALRAIDTAYLKAQKQP